jgi:hypothetical protein
MNEHAIIAGALIDAWADRLDSGIPQAQGSLRTREGQCCLGVYCDVAGIPHTFYREAAATYYFAEGYSAASFPASTLMREIGLTDTGLLMDRNGWDVPDELLGITPELLNTDDHGKPMPIMEWSLAHLNDGGVWTFANIATLLRHNKARLMQWVNDHPAR